MSLSHYIVNSAETEHCHRIRRTVQHHFSSGLPARSYEIISSLISRVVSGLGRGGSEEGSAAQPLNRGCSGPRPFLVFLLETMRTKVYGRARPPRGSYIFAATLVNCGHAASRHIVGGSSSGDVGVHVGGRACVAVRHCVNVSLDNFGVTQFSCFPPCLSLFFFPPRRFVPRRVHRLRMCLSKYILDETWGGRPAYCSHLRSSGCAHYDTVEKY